MEMNSSVARESEIDRYKAEEMGRGQSEKKRIYIKIM